MSFAIVMAFLGLSLVLYVTTGGADYGVGILEILSPRAQRSAVRKAGEKAIAPVWEANHVWLIVALVILFVGFPTIHITLTTTLHIPLVLMLVGIILRGTAFTFRYYDLAPDPATTRLWTWLFRSGSVMVPVLFGHLAAAMARGHLPPLLSGENPPLSFADMYLAPWMGLFPAMTGLFTVVVFGWLAAVFLAGELAHDAPLYPLMRTHALRLSAAVVLMGGAVSASALYEGVPWINLTAVPTLMAVVAGTVAMGLVVHGIRKGQRWMPRVASGGLIVALLGGYWGSAYPEAIRLADGALQWTTSAGPPATMNALAGALLFAGALVVPSLAWLYRLFKTANE